MNSNSEKQQYPRQNFVKGDVLGISMVVFDTKKSVVEQSIKSVLESTIKTEITIVDNSAKESYHELAEKHGCLYIATGGNIGYGSANNLAVKASQLETPYHVVMNPDVILEEKCLELLLEVMINNTNITIVMPTILNLDGSYQNLHHELPRPLGLFCRRFLTKEKKTNPKENFDKIEVASGAFLFLRKSAFLRIGGFDERFFLYLEDIDLSRRIKKIGPIVYCKKAELKHYYAQDSYKKTRSLLWHCVSTIKYFQKWGWFPLLRTDLVKSISEYGIDERG